MRFVPVVLGCCALIATGCKREQKNIAATPPQATIVMSSALQSTLRPGNAPPATPVKNPYGSNAQAISEGQQLFEWYNCSGCHFHGGGGIGPPLIKKQWIYGGEPANLFDTIMKGRPNGMPAWSGKIPEYQVWQIVAYIRAMAGYDSSNVTPSRSDHMETNPSSVPGEVARKK
jgi:cytochrome c oxidase cbb3-type subunit 3